MQKILSSFVLRDYRQYTPEQIQAFRRRSSSIVKHKHNKSALEPTAASNQQRNNHLQLSQNVQITQFNVRNDIEQLGQAVEKIEEKVRSILRSEKDRDSSIKAKRQKLITFSKIQYDDSGSKLPKESPQKLNSSYLKLYRQKMQKKKAQISSGNFHPKFDLKKFKTKLNYTMFNKICLSN